MTTAADVAGYRRVEVGINRTFLSDLKDVTERIAGATPTKQRDILLRAFPEIVLPRITAMQDFAATWAEDLYAEQSLKVQGPRLVLPEDAAFEATVRWAIAPAFDEAAGTVFGNLAGSGQRYIADGGREVVASIEPRSHFVDHNRLRRFPSPGACDWCIETAGVATGSHDHCHCVIAPTFAGDPI